MKIVRGIIRSTQHEAGKIPRFTAAGRPGETFSNREVFGQYGFSSRPLSGAENIMAIEGSCVIQLASADRRYEISLQDGEVAVHTDEGDSLHFKRGRVMEITTGTAIINATTVKLGSSELLPTSGVVTGECACIFGVPHPITSTKVKAQL
jgi:phage gp45-like